jgi:hypothetical protein
MDQERPTGCALFFIFLVFIIGFMQFGEGNTEKQGAVRAAPALHPVFRDRSTSTA